MNELGIFEVLCPECGEDVGVEAVLVDDVIADVIIIEEYCSHEKSLMALLPQVQEELYSYHDTDLIEDEFDPYGLERWYEE